MPIMMYAFDPSRPPTAAERDQLINRIRTDAGQIDQQAPAADVATLIAGLLYLVQYSTPITSG